MFPPPRVILRHVSFIRTHPQLLQPTLTSLFRNNSNSNSLIYQLCSRDIFFSSEFRSVLATRQRWLPPLFMRSLQEKALSFKMSLWAHHHVESPDRLIISRISGWACNEQRNTAAFLKDNWERHWWENNNNPEGLLNVYHTFLDAGGFCWLLSFII